MKIPRAALAGMLSLLDEATRDDTTTLLADAVRESGLPQKTVARRMGVTEGRMSQIVNGHLGSSPTVRTLVRLADALGCRVEIKFVPDPSLRPPNFRPVGTCRRPEYPGDMFALAA